MAIAMTHPPRITDESVLTRWMTMEIGKPLRKYLLMKQIEEIVDFGDLPVFKNATTYPCIIRVLNETPGCEFYVVPVKTLDFPSLDEYVLANYYPIKQDTLTIDGWTLGNLSIENLLKKVTTYGQSLNNYLNGQINYGIKTGLNKAFVIDEQTKL
jgi:adenine-specific DNA-methyltransferase